MLGLVDWQLLALFIGLFVVIRGFEVSGWNHVVRDALAAAPRRNIRLLGAGKTLQYTSRSPAELEERSSLR